MAINTRDARRDAEKRRIQYQNNYTAIICSLFNNSVTLKGFEGDYAVPKRYLLKILREFGGVAYDKQTKLFLRYVEQGIDVYGLPKKYTLYGANGYNVQRDPSEVVILRANDLKFPIREYIDQQISKLIEFDMSIEQNLDAIKTMTIVEVKDQSNLLSVVNEMESRRIGASILYKSKAVSQDSLNVSSTNAQYLIDKLQQARKEVYNETLSSLGIEVANIDKRERVQEAEIDASNSYAIDCINVLINTFNYDAEQGGIPIRLEGNTTLYTDKELREEVMLQEKENKGENITDE